MTVFIHVRFAPSGRVSEIGECPEGLDPQAWYNALSVEAAHHYQPLAGGRGLFRLTREDVERLQRKAP